MTLEATSQTLAILLLLWWVKTVIWLVIEAIKTAKPPLYTDDEIRQMLMTEQHEHKPRPRLRAGAITEIKNEQ